EVPAEVASFMRLPGLGPKTARRLWLELGITTVDGLQAAAEAHQLRGLAGLGARSEDKILAALSKPKVAEGRSGGCSGRRSRSYARSRPRSRPIRQRSGCRSPAPPAVIARRCATST